MTDRFKPFADDEVSVEIAGLSLENGRAAIVLHGDATIPADKAGLAALDRMIGLLASARDELASRADLPDRVDPVDPSAVTVVANPFGDGS